MLMQAQYQIKNNPIDLLEDIFTHTTFGLERRGINEIVVEINGKWKDLLLFFAWEEKLKCLHMSCFMDIESTINNKSKIFELLALINENLWLGHFSYWTEREIPIFKHAVLVDEKDTHFEEKLHQMIDIAVDECEKMYPVFQAVLVQGLSPHQALFAASGLLQ